MPLLNLWKADKQSILRMSIEQIVSTAGDGKLLDSSSCQDELRQYLSETSTDYLSDYANYCLAPVPIRRVPLLLTQRGPRIARQFVADSCAQSRQ